MVSATVSAEIANLGSIFGVAFQRMGVSTGPGQIATTLMFSGLNS